jgi:hypothetical protein
MFKKIRRHFLGGGGARSDKQEVDNPAALGRIIDHLFRNGIIIMPAVSAF